ncbi:glycosyltransferase family 9 protein [Microbacterium sp. LRZ72]|uniref:glycosyltransferase family 9 protein n=1 Tax=Microbacterium sp. LRZ72 TaxID=2942481 RepID=UPI0029A7DC39|nr:glycosyltransferase family 9 protein [Microbacterium sp. LRZ72]MDX2376730.1 glycosyltransferase family 9 protein [Microbacterium sp. LRZ72]
MRATPALDTQPFDDVLKIAVLRGGGLGDLLFTLPALDALAETYPEAEIVLLGTPLHRALLEGRPGPVARVEELPFAVGVRDPGDRGEDPAQIDAFLRRMRGEHFDLACQLHGGGRYSNPFLLEMNARHTVGTATPDAAPLERNLPYLYYQHEVFRWLETVALAGATSAGPEPRLAVPLDERLRGVELMGEAGGVVVIHPGATDPRRRWPAERFAEVAARCATDGMRVLLVGDGEDAALADRIADEAARVAGDGVVSLAGELSLSDLTGLLTVADLFIGNDSGPRHLAHAVGVPTVGIFMAGNLINGGPVTRGRHRVQLSWTTHCPVCGRDATQVGWTAPRCEHDVPFVADVPVDAVYDDARTLLALTATRVHPPGT